MQRYCTANLFPHVWYIWQILRTYHLQIPATSWKQCTCTNIGHLSVSHRSSLQITQVNTHHQCLLTDQIENSHCVPTTRLYLTSRQVTCMWTVSFGTSSGKWASTRVVRIPAQLPSKHLASAREYECLPHRTVVEAVQHSPGTLYNAQLQALLSNTPFVKTRLKTPEKYELCMETKRFFPACGKNICSSN
jgi:hypothetical protein